VSSFASLGDKADVSGNDLLQYWEEDPETDVILLALASIGNRSKFVRLAHRITHHKPIVAVKVADEPDELFTGAGVIQVETFDALFETARVLTGTT
jgi:acyl-CoA synthetase (NDP forming)